MYKCCIIQYYIVLHSLFKNYSTRKNKISRIIPRVMVILQEGNSRYYNPLYFSVEFHCYKWFNILKINKNLNILNALAVPHYCVYKMTSWAVSKTNCELFSN